MVGGVGKALIVFLIALALIYTVFWVRAGRPRPRLRRRPPQPPPAVVGPDDDPEFLRGLERPERHESDEDAPGG